MHDFLEKELHLELSQEKTLITNASSQAAKFLGYEIKAQRMNDYLDPKAAEEPMVRSHCLFRQG